MKEKIGGHGGPFTPSNRKEIVNWPELLKINPDNHPLSPTLGKNGALTFLDGRAETGVVGSIYPTLLKVTVGVYQYLGHYKVVRHITMPVERWQAFKDEEKLRLVRDIAKSFQWAKDLLSSKGLSINSSDIYDKQVKVVQGFFKSCEKIMFKNELDVASIRVFRARLLQPAVRRIEELQV